MVIDDLEIKKFFSSYLPDNQINLIVEKTRGWVYVINRIIQNFRKGRLNYIKSTLNIVEFETSDIFKQVVEQLNTDSYRFLLNLVILKKFSNKIIDHVFELNDSKNKIEFLVKNGCFILYTDDLYEIHPLFSDYLLSESKEEADRFLKKATIWCIRNNNFKLATEYAKNSNSENIKNIIINNLSDVLVRDLGELSTINDWIIKNLNKGHTEDYTKFKYWLAWSLAFSYEWNKSQKFINELYREILLSNKMSDLEKKIFITKLDSIEIALLTFQDDWQACFDRIEKWKFNEIHAESFDKAVVYSAEFLGLINSREYAKAKIAILKAKEFIKKTDSVYGYLWVNILDSYSLIEFGEFDLAIKNLNSLYYKALNELGQSSTILSTICSLLSYLYLEKNDIDESVKLQSISLKNIDRHGFINSAELGLITLIRSEYSDARNESEFFYRYQNTLNIYPIRLGINLSISLVEMKFINHISFDHLIKDLRLLISQSENLPNSTYLNFLYSEALYLIAEMEFDEARKKINYLITYKDIKSQRYMYTKILIIDIYLYAMDNYNIDLLKDKISRVLSLCILGGYKALLLNYAKLIIDPIKNLINQNVKFDDDENKLINFLFEEFNFKVETNHVFSKRELEILQNLNSDLSYGDIASKLNISQSTVKWHVNNIYSKLNVKNRSGAIVTAKKENYL